MFCASNIIILYDGLFTAQYLWPDGLHFIRNIFLNVQYDPYLYILAVSPYKEALERVSQSSGEANGMPDFLRTPLDL